MIITGEKAIKREIVPGVFQTHFIDKQFGSGGVSMGMVTIQPGAGIPPHVHRVEDAMVVVEGEGIFLVGEQGIPFKAGMGLLAPAGVRHGLKNNGENPLKIVYTWPSIEVERFFD